MDGKHATRPPERREPADRSSRTARDPANEPLAVLLERAVAALAGLVRAEGELARAEVRAEVEHAARTLGAVLASAVLVAAGWAFVMAALAVWMSWSVGWAAALGIVGGAHVLAGGVLFFARTVASSRRSREPQSEAQ